MPYIHEPVLAKGGTLKADNKTVKRTILDNDSVKDKSGKLIISGRAEFAADHFTGHKYFAAPKLSTIQYGKVKSIDYSEAKKIKGVIDFVDYTEVPTWTADITQWGQPVCAVIADNWYTAIRATEAIKVEYEDKGNEYFDPDVVFEKFGIDDKQQPISSGYAAGAVHTQGTFSRGEDPKDHYKECDQVLETSYPYTSSWAHNELEAHQSIAWWVNDEVYVYTGTQEIFSPHSNIKTYWGVPSNKGHLYSRFNCGGFGGKTADWGLYGAIAASKKVGGYPVLYKNTRQSNHTDRQRMFSIRSTQKIGFMNDGTIKCWEADMICDNGRTNFCPDNADIFGMKTTWNVPYARFRALGINTTSPKRYFWRDVADPGGAYNAETTLDKVAYLCGLNQLDLRLKNVLPEDNTDVSNNGLHHGSFAIKELLNYVAEWSDYRTKWHLPLEKKVEDIYPEKKGDKRYHGIAISSHLDSHGGISGSSRGGILKAQTDGTFSVVTGSARGTAGGTTVCCTVVAEVLGAKDEDVLLGDWANTDSCLAGGNQASSSHTISISSVFYNVAKEMKWKLLTKALTNADIKAAGVKSIEELDTKDSTVYVIAKPEVSIPFSKVGLSNTIAATAYGYDANKDNDRNALQVLMDQRAGGAWKDKTVYGTDKVFIKKDEKVSTNGQSGAVCEVAVDVENGEVEILNYYLAVDTGCTIFKQGALREMGAATELFHSQAFYFGDVYDDKTGAALSGIYTEGQFPTYMDIKFDNVQFTDYQSECAGGPFGCHGIAEPSLTNFCTIAMAIFNAIGLWADHEKGALGPDKVLRAINERGLGADYKALMATK